MELSDIFIEPIRSGVYRLDNTSDLSRLLDVATEKKFLINILDGLQFANKQQFLEHFAAVTHPPVVIDNWDFFEDLLHATEWLGKEAGELILYKNIEHFHHANRKDFDILVDIFRVLADFRNQRIPHTPVLVFLQGDRSIELPFLFEFVEL